MASNPVVLCELEIWQTTLKKNSAPFLCYFKLCASFRSHWWMQTGVTVQKCPIRVKIGNFFVLCNLEIWQMTLKKNRASLLCYFKLCASFHSHRWIETGVTVWQHPIRIKISDFLSRVILKFNFVHHFIAIGELKLELQSGDYQFGSKSAIFIWCDLEIWWMTLKNNRAPLLCYFKLQASFHSHL